MANGHGGARPGAGRKQKAVRNADAAAKVDALIAGNLDGIVDTLIRRATEGGDTSAARYLIDRLLGKALSAEVSYEDEPEPEADDEHD